MDLNNIGFYLIEDFITTEEEMELIKYLASPSPKKSKSRNSIQRFGSKKPYNSNMVSNEIPNHFNFLLDRLMERNLLEIRPDSISVNQYLKGQEITPHIDSKTSGKIISILSLLSEATMVLENKKEKHETLVPARSLIQLKDEVRNDWRHSIKPVNDMRYSIVFRCSI